MQAVIKAVVTKIERSGGLIKVNLETTLTAAPAPSRVQAAGA